METLKDSKNTQKTKKGEQKDEFHSTPGEGGAAAVRCCDVRGERSAVCQCYMWDVVEVLKLHWKLPN